MKKTTDRYYPQLEKIRKIKNSCYDLVWLAKELEKLRLSSRAWYIDTTVYNDDFFDRQINEYKTELKKLIKNL